MSLAPVAQTVMPRRFFCGGELVLASIVGDLAVDKAHRSVMPALKLVRAAKQVAREGRHDVARGLLGEALDLDLRRAPPAVRFELQRRRRTLQRTA